jgi:dipeptidyl aminopeptidase/acylaminoacyl peptidase
MRTLRAAHVLVLLPFAGACGAEPAPPGALPKAQPPAPAQPSSTASAITLPPAPAIDAQPTLLSDAQKQRDAARVPLAKAIVGAYANWDGLLTSLVANFAPDGKHVLFGSMRSGIPEIYEGDTAKIGDPPRAVTTGPERAIWARYMRDPGGGPPAILFLRDSQGDENHRIFRVSQGGSGLVDLSAGGSQPLHRGEPHIPRRLLDTMFYPASRATSPETMIYAQKLAADAAGHDPQLVYTSPHPADLADVADDGKQALLIESDSVDAQRVVELDATSGKALRVYPPEGKKVGVHSAAYLAGGRRIVVTTDEGGEAAIALALDRRSHKEAARYVNESPRTATLYAVPSPDGDRIALSVDCGNHGEVRVLDGATLKLQRDVAVPLGDVHVGSWRDDGKVFSILASQPDRPTDIYAVEPATGNVKALRDDKRTGLDGLPPVQSALVSVQAFDGLSIPVNLYLPKVDPPRPLPTLVIFHGGPATSYAIRWTPFARFFVSLGYAVLEPNVRGSSGFGRAYENADNLEKRGDWLKDLESINAWTKSQPWCDADRVIVWGQSYGGYTTLMALTRQPTLWRAGVDLYGPADLKAFLRVADAGVRDYLATEFGDVDMDGALLDRFSPIRDVDAIVAPLFVYAGQNDPRVPRSESDAIVLALRKQGTPVEYMVAPNEGHSVDRDATKIELLTRAARFLEDATKGP